MLHDISHRVVQWERHHLQRQGPGRRRRAERQDQERQEIELNAAGGGEVRIGSLVPHRNGLMDVEGKRLMWRRLQAKPWGLLPAAERMSLHALCLPAVRVWEDFQLPRATGFELETWGGVSYHSVGVLRPVDVCDQGSVEILREFCSSTATVLWTVGVVIVTFALPTQGGAEADVLWVGALRRGAEAGARAAKQKGTKGFCGSGISITNRKSWARHQTAIG